MDEKQLIVEKAYPNDSGRGVARLDPKVMLDLYTVPGDIIEIEGKKRTSAKVWRLNKMDWDKDIIRIDGFIRQNVGAGISEQVKISKPEVKIAQKLVIAPPEGTEIQFVEGDNNSVKRQIMKRSINKGDLIPVFSTMAHPTLGRVVTGQTILYIAVDTIPEGIVLIKEETDIKLIMDKHLSSDVEDGTEDKASQIDEIESYINSLIGFDKLKKGTYYSRDELYEILGDKNYKLMFKLYDNFNKLLYPH